MESALASRGEPHVPPFSEKPWFLWELEIWRAAREGLHGAVTTAGDTDRAARDAAVLQIDGFKAADWVRWAAYRLDVLCMSLETQVLAGWECKTACLPGGLDGFGTRLPWTRRLPHLLA